MQQRPNEKQHNVVPHKALLFIPAMKHKASLCHALGTELAEATPSLWSVIQNVLPFFSLKKKKTTKCLYFLVFKAADSFLALTD